MRIISNKFKKIRKMRIENQVCTLEQAKSLKELGVKQSSIFFFEWNDHKRLHNLRYVDSPNYKVEEKDYSAFTCAELGVMLPPYLDDEKGTSLLTWFFDDGECPTVKVDYFEELGHGQYFISNEPDTESKTEAEARAAMLIYLIENNLASVEEINKRLAPDVHATKQSDKETK